MMNIRLPRRPLLAVPSFPPSLLVTSSPRSARGKGLPRGSLHSWVYREAARTDGQGRGGNGKQHEEKSQKEKREREREKIEQRLRQPLVPISMCVYQL